MCAIDGQLRPIAMRDGSIALNTPTREEADRTRAGRVRGAPLCFRCTDRRSRAASARRRGRRTIDVMKMTAPITAPIAGVLAELTVSGPGELDDGGLIAVVR
jgi:pyruvate carboxylase